MEKFWQKNKKALVILFILVASLPWTYSLGQKAVELITNANYLPAALIVDASSPLRPMRPVWQGVAQGHEEQGQRLDKAAPYLRQTGVKYVRIDHIYDGFGVVGRVDGRLSYDWSKLDLLVADILASGAKPYFSLSYMPSEISKGDILDTPREWGEWGQVVAATVAHYSRDYRGGLEGVIYEVWNEPDLFGGWKMYGDKNYVTLYSYASQAAVGVRGAKSFEIGGPATTGFYPAWVDGFYKKLDEQVRIDFFSWHRYSASIDDFVRDATQATELIAPQIKRPQKLYISEWGVDPERSKTYDSLYAGAHYLAVVAALEPTNVDLALAFEVQDGVSGESQWHGGWGMLTNPKYGAVLTKPRFKALSFASRLVGSKLTVAGQGEYVTSLASRDDQGVTRVMAVNYDPRGRHQEVVPLTITGLDNVSYIVTEEYLGGRVVKNELVGLDGVIKMDLSLTPSEAVLVTVVKK